MAGALKVQVRKIRYLPQTCTAFQRNSRLSLKLAAWTLKIQNPKPETLNPKQGWRYEPQRADEVPCGGRGWDGFRTQGDSGYIPNMRNALTPNLIVSTFKLRNGAGRGVRLILRVSLNAFPLVKEFTGVPK